MKILVCEHLTAKGHTNLCANVCRLLTMGGHHVIAVIPQNFTKDLSFCEVVRMKLKYYYDEYPHKRSTLTKASYCLKVQRFISNLYKVCDVEATFVVTYDEVSLALGRLAGYMKGITFVLQNVNPDSIQESKIHRLAYELLNRRVYSVVLGGFIKDFLVFSLKTDPRMVSVLPHPLNTVDDISESDIDCVGISNSNDDSIVEKIIEKEKKEGIIRKNGLKVILKSKNYKFDNGYLKIISGFIDSEIYDDYISRAKCIFLPFPLSFKSRMSGTLIEALSNRKSVIGTNIPAVVHAEKCYSTVIKRYNESTFIDDIIDAGMVNEVKNKAFDRFKYWHSDNVLCALLSEAIENAIANKPMNDAFDF